MYFRSSYILFLSAQQVASQASLSRSNPPRHVSVHCDPSQSKRFRLSLREPGSESINYLDQEEEVFDAARF